jgi:menaquinone-dependent protoporphyrinogen IX oxidase
MQKLLIVYYSRTGTTAHVARQIADALGADLDVIEDATARDGVVGYVRSALEASLYGLPTVRWQRDPADYALVVIGTPVWLGNIASPVRSYLFQQRARLRRVGLFTTSRGLWAEQAQRELALLCAATAAVSGSFLQDDVLAGSHQAELTRFIFALRELRDDVRAA